MALKYKKLTRINLRALKLGERISEHGIHFERLSNGDGRYVINIMVDGKRIHRVVGKESDGVTRQQAEDFIAKIRTDARHGRLNLPKGRKLSLSFAEASKKYIDKLKAEDGKDIDKKIQRFDKHLDPFFTKKPLCCITTSDLEQYKKYRLKQGAKNGTINRELAVISHLLNKAVDWKWLDFVPCKVKRIQAGVDLPTVQRISGHKTLQMVVRYSHQNGQHIQQAMDKLEQRYHSVALETP